MSQRLPVVLMWHMHQPQYRDALTGEYVLPWTYLHALKDYSDMAAHLEENPAARAVVNFTPVLIEQLQEYAQRVAAGATLAVARIKQAVMEGMDLPLDDALSLERDLMAPLFDTADAKEGIAAFAEKRSATFAGR